MLNKTVFAALALLLAASTAAQAQSDEIFEVRRTELLPSTDEYKDVPEGLLFSEQERLRRKNVSDDEPVKEAPAQEPAKTTVGKAANNKELKGQQHLRYEEIVTLYRQGKYDGLADSLAILVENKHHGAEEILGIMYRLGQGVPKDPEKAKELLARAAEFNRALAQHHLAIMYFTGEGFPVDKIKALTWLHLAIAYYPSGPEKKRAEQDRDNIYTQLSRRDKEIALQSARDWLAARGESHLLDIQ